MEISQRYVFIDKVVNRFKFKNNQITLLIPVSTSYLKQALDYLKHGLVFIVARNKKPFLRKPTVEINDAI